MYWSSIIWYLSWPALIGISYLLVKFTLTKYKNELEQADGGGTDGTHPEK